MVDFWISFVSLVIVIPLYTLIIPPPPINLSLSSKHLRTSRTTPHDLVVSNGSHLSDIKKYSYTVTMHKL